MSSGSSECKEDLQLDLMMGNVQRFGLTDTDLDDIIGLERLFLFGSNLCQNLPMTEETKAPKATEKQAEKEEEKAIDGGEIDGSIRKEKGETDAEALEGIREGMEAVTTVPATLLLQDSVEHEVKVTLAEGLFVI